MGKWLCCQPCKISHSPQATVISSLRSLSERRLQAGSGLLRGPLLRGRKCARVAHWSVTYLGVAPRGCQGMTFATSAAARGGADMLCGLVADIMPIGVHVRVVDGELFCMCEPLVVFHKLGLASSICEWHSRVRQGPCGSEQRKEIPRGAPRQPPAPVRKRSLGQRHPQGATPTACFACMWCDQVGGKAAGWHRRQADGCAKRGSPLMGGWGRPS